MTTSPKGSKPVLLPLRPAAVDRKRVRAQVMPAGSRQAVQG